VGDIAGHSATLTAGESRRVMLNDQRKQADKRALSRSKTMQPISKVMKLPKQQTFAQKRLIETAGVMSGEPDVTFQHAIFCQVSLPYRDPGDDVRIWERLNGAVHLKVLAGEAMDPRLRRLRPLGLPFGPKPRLILAHLNAESIRTQSPEIEVEDSLTAFVKRLGLDPKGRNMRVVKDQLGRLSAAAVRFGFVRGDEAVTVNTQIVSTFNLWLTQDEHQRVLWPSSVTLSLEYFESLLAHAVPLDERALRALSHSALALDLYAWLAQRLHRIPKPHRQFIPWPAVKDQFGPGVEKLNKFRQPFMVALRQVHAVYPAMKIEITGHGLFLYTSPPPVVKTGIVVQLSG
jgi:hypothetical protein